MLNLSSYDSIQTNLFVKITYPSLSSDKFSDYHKDFTFNGDTYNGLGFILSVSSSEDTLRAAPSQIEVVLSGIPINSLSDALNSNLKGSEIAIYRAFFDPTTGELLSLAENPAGKFRGVIDNFTIDKDLPMGSSTGSLTITLICSSYVELFQNKIAGRRTNPIDQKLYDPTDVSMDRIPSLAKSNFDFGAPK
jgi:hypothetical protein